MKTREVRSGALRLLVIAVVLTLLATACDGSTTTTTEPTTTAAPTTTLPASTTASVAPSTTTAAPTTTGGPATTTSSTTTTTAPPTTTTLPGEPIDIGPRAGDILIVAGVVFDDVLNVREIPGLDGEIVDMLEPTADDVTALGNNRLLPTSIWFEIDTGDVVGWASGRFLFHRGFTDDITAEVVAELGAIPIGATVDEVGAVVALARASQNEPKSDITVAVAANLEGDLAEIVIDVIGFGDDAVGGERLRVFAEQVEGGGFSLDTVERTLLCLRGATEDGLCV